MVGKFPSPSSVWYDLLIVFPPYLEERSTLARPASGLHDTLATDRVRGSECYALSLAATCGTGALADGRDGTRWFLMKDEMQILSLVVRERASE